MLPGLQSTKCRACHANYKHRAPEPKGRHRAPSAAPATQIPSTERRSPRDARGRPRKFQAQSAGAQGTPGDARAYITPLAEHQAPEPKGRQGTPGPCRAPSTAYITPLAEHQVPRLPRKFQAKSGGAQGTQGDARGRQGTPGRTSRPLQSTKCRACHANYNARAYITSLGEHQVRVSG